LTFAFAHRGCEVATDSFEMAEFSILRNVAQDYESCERYRDEISQRFDSISRNLNFNLQYVEHHEKFFSGRRRIDIGICNFLESKRQYIFPLWPYHQSKATYLPDIVKISKQYHCHLVVLLDGDHHWSTELSNIEDEMITVADASLNVHVESECADPTGECVLTWMRFAPEAQYDLSIISLSGGGEPTLILDEKDAYGYRCAILRITNWNPGDAPEQKKWDLIQGLFSRFWQVRFLFS
jgi:hypothetical protein